MSIVSTYNDKILFKEIIAIYRVDISYQRILTVCPAGIQDYNVIMISKDIEFCFTKDGTAGLYNRTVDDVYHSIFGAKTEAVEKFVRPLGLLKNFAHKKEIKVLDICFGIGYNSKALIEEIVKLKINSKVKIDILENDRKLVELSPFIKDNCEIASAILFRSLYQIIEPDILPVIFDKDNQKFFKPAVRRFIRNNKHNHYSLSSCNNLNVFLHNIYYHYVSQRHKKGLIPPNCRRFLITPYIDDARKSILRLSGEYDIVFLDAFTPAKLPTLWSLEFFIKLFELMNDESVLVTYSNSAAVRHAMVRAGFFAGKLFDRDNRHCGTIAAKSKRFIKNGLDEFDKGLMETKAGIFFTDPGLCSSPEEILADWNLRKQNSNLRSTSSFIKNYKNKTEEICTT